MYKVKHKADGNVERIKVRLIANGYKQQEGLHYWNIFTSCQTYHRLLLAYVTIQKWEIHQLDVKNAFLNGYLQEVLYMALPPGFTNKLFPQHVCKIQKALYGLQRAPEAWYERLSTFLISKNFYSSAVGTSLFIQKSKNGLLALLLYVDDMLITSSSIKHLQGFLADLKSEFNMKNVGIVNYFLGIEIVKTDTRLFLTQGWYGEKIFKRANMLDCKPSDTQMPLKL